MNSEQDLPEKKPDMMLAFSRFKEEIEKEANEKADLILGKAKEEVASIKAAGQKEADSMKNEQMNVAQREANQIRIREVSRKKLTVKMDYLQSRDVVFNEILVEARSKLQEYTKTSKYADFLKSLLKESAISMNGGSLEVFLRSEDKSLLSQDNLDKIAEEVSTQTGSITDLKIAKSDLKTLGGLKLVRTDNRLFVDNTFEARIDRKEESIRVALVEILES